MAHLHLHSQYSVIDGRGQIEDYIKLIQQDKQEALALTDHGTLGGVIEGYLASKKAGLKFIPGIELYVDAYELREKNYPGHITVLAKNEAGYRALIAANNLAHRQFYYRPRVTLRQLIDQGFLDNWILLSGCLSSPIFEYPYSESETLVKELAKQSGGFFLEAMWHYSEDEQFTVKQDAYLERVAALHKSTGIPVVLTNDCHYAYKQQEEFHSQLISQARSDNHELEFDGSGFSFKTMTNMQSLAQALGVPNALDNAVEIAKLCNVHIPEADNIKWYVPDITEGRPYESIRELTESRLSGLPEVYRRRYEYELDVLSTSPAILNSYLVANDVIRWCDKRSIPVAARGSMAGSLVSWLLGITQEDPVKYNLSFSRAVNPARPTIPDFDLDVSSRYRADVLNYLKERYEGNIPIAAYTHYGPKGALRKVLHMEGLRSPPEINELSKQLPDDWSDGDFEYSAGQHRYIGGTEWTDTVPEQYHNFVALYKGLYSGVTVHPSGVLISGPERELEHEVPLQWIASSKTLSSAFDMYTLKKIGLFKLDVLGLKTLDQLAYMESISGEKVPNDDYDDPEVLAAFGADLLAEVFQMDGYAAREVIKSIDGIKHFEDIVAANTLARPGCAQFTPFYRTGLTTLLKEYPQIEEVIGYTNGLILYQEQVMEICRVLADFDDAEQDDVKEAIKYFRHEVFRGIAEKFRERCVVKGIDATNILKAIEDMSKYTYNRAHAMTYAAIAYKMMWYKVHYPAVYYAAVFDAAGDKQRLVLESHFFGVNWQPADVNYSDSDTLVDLNTNVIRLGLSAIKGVGPAAYGALAKARPFSSMEDLEERVERKKCNIRVIGQLRDAFACTSLGVPGTYVAFQNAFGFNYRFLNAKLNQELSNWQQEAAGYRLAGFITDVRESVVRAAGPNHGKEMARLDITNIRGRKRCVMFPDIWKKARGKIYNGAPVKLEGEYQLNGEFIAKRGYEAE